MEVKLGDFGLTQRIIEGDGQGSGMYTTPAGTFCYMAPEVLGIVDSRTSNYQDKVDVFSYGTTCFNILTCKVAGALDFTNACSKREFYEAVKLNNWRAWVKGKPEYLIDLIARCWDFDPGRRPTFAAICCVLQRAMLCILSAPVINVGILSQAAAQCDLGGLYWELERNYGVQHEVIGTRMMQSCQRNLREDVGSYTKFNDNARSFIQELDKIVGINTNVRTEANVRGVKSKLRAILKKIKGKQLNPEVASVEEPVFVAIDEACSCLVLSLSFSRESNLW